MSELEQLPATVDRLIEVVTELRGTIERQQRQLDVLEVWAAGAEDPPAQTGTQLAELRGRVELLNQRQKGDPGPPGKQGPPGPPGRHGTDGAASAATVIREVKISG
jgi:hypothetical protein